MIIIHKEFIQLLRKYYANNPDKKNKLNSFWTGVQNLSSSDLGNFLSDIFEKGNREDIIFSIVGSYNFFMNKIDEKELDEDERNRISLFETEVKSLIAPELVEEPCHIINIENDKLCNKLRTQAILTDSVNHFDRTIGEPDKTLRKNLKFTPGGFDSKKRKIYHLTIEDNKTQEKLGKCYTEK